jgi:hypothetical protein
VPPENSLLRCTSIASIAAWQFDVVEGVTIEIEGEEFVDRVAPT